jgi:chromosome segregation ATPase
VNEIALSSDINVITAEINSYKQIAGQSIWEIGRRLNYVKENDLAHGEFMNWLESININYRVANKFMNIAKELPNMTTSSNLSYEALYLITTLPEENKQEEIKKIAEGNPSTTREVQELKKQLKQKDDRISALESAEPRVIEKRVEVPPSDYYSLQRANESLQREVENNVTKLSGVKSLLDLEQQKYKLLESESREAKELKSNIDTLLDTKESLNNQIKLLTEFNEKTGKLKQVFDSELASLRFRPYVNELSSTEATNTLWDLVDSISFWVDEMNKMRPNDNMKIIEGELL